MFAFLGFTEPVVSYWTRNIALIDVVVIGNVQRVNCEILECRRFFVGLKFCESRSVVFGVEKWLGFYRFTAPVFDWFHMRCIMECVSR